MDAVSRITSEEIHAEAVEREVAAAGLGAVVTFTGRVRDENEGHAVTRLDYEAYPEMAAAKLAEVVETVKARWPGVRVALRHRVGALAVGDVAVVIAVAAPHRREAFEACAFAIDHLKETVPIWKRETGPDGTHWVGCKP
ncbi:MAG: molybdenum cofactor biosynthesis protein MoaE [Deltaproteobacteria bacterium]|nr:molybdenum cofactor biosynthesis protein MoaE [Deltaproteobacteria bacterium]